MKSNTHGVRYLGSKSKLTSNIVEIANSLTVNEKTIIDVFTGTTRVAQAFRKEGWKVTTSDLAWASECYSDLFITSSSFKHLRKYIEDLNKLEVPKEHLGWLAKNYSSHPCLVWSRENAAKADCIRDNIEKLEISRKEKNILISSLIFALDKVDNTVGIQQAYLKGPKSPRLNTSLFLTLPEEINGPIGKHIVGDALLIEYENAEIAYLDPPYTGADYSTYYHIWDSIARWDKPDVGLKTNRRKDRIKSSNSRDTSISSPWYNKKTAYEATKTLIERLPVEWVIFSYSNEGFISLEEMKQINGFFSLKEIEHKRHVMSSIGAGANPHAKQKNKEYLIIYKK